MIPPLLLPGTMIFCRAASVVENIPQEPPLLLLLLLLLLAPHPGGDSTAAAAAAPLVVDVALCST